MSATIGKIFRVAIISTAVIGCNGAQADAIAGKFLGADFTLNGFIRTEDAIKTTDKQNPYNQNGDRFNGIPIQREPGNPLDGYSTRLVPGSLTVAGLNLNLAPLSAGVDSISVRGGVPNEDASMNYHVVRLELSPTVSFGDFSLISRIRSLYDPGRLGYADFNAKDYNNVNGGISGGLPDLYQGTPNYFGYQVEGNKHPVPLEFSGKNYFVDFPALFLQYNKGPLTLRLGNQTVAWGQAIFFRVFDVANGLDLRRNLILGRALEEYSDQRESALGLRATYQVNDQIVADAFAQKFQPTILPNPNTPLNVVPSQFTIHDRYSQYGFDKKLNYGMRIKGDYGKFSLQAMAVERYASEGTFRWTKSGVNKALPNSNVLGAAFNQYCQAVLGSPVGQGCGPQLAQTPFEASPAGVFSAEEWFDAATDVRLSGTQGLDYAVNDFPAAQQLLARAVGDDTQAANNELDAFFTAGEGLHGHIERVYVKEQVYGLGGSYVVDAEPGSILDQLIINLETSFAPNHPFIFSNTGLGQKIEKSQEYTAALVMEKYQRFSKSFPATYLVAQYLFKSQSDLLNRRLNGYGGDAGSFPLPETQGGAGRQPKLPGGVEGAHYFAFAFLQPWPAYIYELSAAALIDARGGILVQPGLQWKPKGDITVNLYYDYINGHVGQRSKNIISSLEFADELGIRVGYQF